jgi:predicted xylose isomerase-like sugar epimerase
MARKIKRALRGQLSYEPFQNQVMELKDLIARSGKPKEEQQQQENRTSRLRKLI